MKLSNTTETRKLQFIGDGEKSASGVRVITSECECYQLVLVQPKGSLSVWEVHTGNGEADFTGSLEACKGYCQGMEDGQAMALYARSVDERLNAIK